MRSRTRFVWETLLAAILCLTLAWINYALWHDTVDISPALNAGVESVAGTRQSSARSDADRTHGFIATQALSRPLFYPNRREYVAPITPPPASPVEIMPTMAVESERPAILFQGTRFFNGRHAALVAVSETADPQWLAVGDKLDAWTVSEITDNQLRISTGQQSISFELYP